MEGSQKFNDFEIRYPSLGADLRPNNAKNEKIIKMKIDILKVLCLNDVGMFLGFLNLVRV